MSKSKKYISQELSKIIRDTKNLNERVKTIPHLYKIYEVPDAKILHKKRREGD